MSLPYADYSAVGLVNKGWEFFQGKGNEMLWKTTQSLDAIAYPLWGLEAPVITYDPLVIEAGTFVRPDVPEAPEFSEIDDTVPEAPTLSDITLDALPAMPTAPDFSGMRFVKPGEPNIAAPQPPAGTDVVLINVEVPDAPAFVMPEEPELYELNLPAIPDLEIPAFAGVRPTLDLQAPTDGLNWAYQAYDRTTINSLKARLENMIEAGLALPPDVEQAIFDRARGREDMLSLQQEQEAERLLASRGIRNPTGHLPDALQQIRDKARLTSSGASRDLGIEIVRQNVQAVQFGLNTLFQVESTLLQDHLATQGLFLDAAKAAHLALIEVFNGQVALHNAQWEGFKAEAQVHESQIRAIAVQVDMFKARIEAEKVKGDVNESLVRALGERIRALSALADMHRAQVEGAKAKGEINVQRLEQVRLKLQAYTTELDGYSKHWDAYGKQVDAELAGLRFHEVQGNVYGQQVSAWRGLVEAQGSRIGSQINIQGQALERYRTTLAGIATRVQAQSTNVDAKARIFQSRTSLFAAQGQVSAAESAAGDRTAQLRVEQSRLLYDASARNAEVAGNFSLKKADMAIEGHRGAAQVWGQMAASLYSGVNLGASTSYGETMSWAFQGN